jgi:hypothetical protein
VNDVRYVARKQVFPSLEKMKSATFKRSETTFIYEKVNPLYLRKSGALLFTKKQRIAISVFNIFAFCCIIVKKKLVFNKKYK